MRKNYCYLLAVLVLFTANTYGQRLPCGSDQVRQRLIAQHPEILQYQAMLEQQIKNGLSKIDYSKAARTTFVDQSGNPDFWYDIPIVIHIIHDYGAEYVSDEALFNDLKDWNIVYSMQNYDTSLVIPTFKPYIGNIHMRLHLATIDPNGNPTKGITRHRSYLTYVGGDQSKLDDWPNVSYVNIWVVNNMSPSNNEAAAYAYFPDEGAVLPVYDGIIALYNYLPDSYSGGLAVSKTIPHEMGHVFNLYHPWGPTNYPEESCGDDGVDDTPPTTGHLEEGCNGEENTTFYVGNVLYDTACATNYFKIYTNIAGGDSLVKYPDTVNAQNIMDYTYCARMFTKGQAVRMHAAANSGVALRYNLWDSTNLVNTGVTTPAGGFASTPVLKPIPEFSATNGPGEPNANDYQNHMYYFVFPGSNSPVEFNNESWNDTVNSVSWQFGNSATPSTSNSNNVAVQFADGGWADVKLTAHGTAGDTTVDFPRSIYVANPTATPGVGYYEEFSGADTAQWPMFNYYNNEFHWQYANVGYDDNSSVMYTGYDSRINLLTGALPFTGTPQGDIDDLFSIPLDLSGFNGNPCSLNFYYSGATRTSQANCINDSLVVQYATGMTNTWTTLAVLTGNTLCNMGNVGTSYVPTQPGDWALFSMNLPAGAITPYTVFRFRYKPNPAVEQFGYVPEGGGATVWEYLPSPYSSGNNFYMDRFTVSPWPAGVSEIKLTNMDAVVAPNPTSGDAYVVVKDIDNTSAQVVVTDITGKTVYTASQPIVNGDAHILIPHSAVSIPGMYIVQTTTGNQVHTQKLVVE